MTESKIQNPESRIPRAARPFHLMIKPAGAACNLACQYCYYLEKAALYPGATTRMDLATLERVTEAYIGAHPGPEVVFGWQGGEPLLMGQDFFRAAVALQRKYARPGITISNALQTNGTLIDDAWAAFFAEHGFLVGVSIDGPPDLHDRYRLDRGGQPSHATVMAGLGKLQEHKAEHNALVTVNRANVEHPLRVYRFLRDAGLEFLQFIPIVERESRTSRKMTPYSVRGEAYGRFLNAVFDEWSLHDVGSMYVQLFECGLSVWLGQQPSLCVYAPSCGWALALEHNGDLYACDHFVYPDHQRGPFGPDTAAALVEGTAQRAFGAAKADLSATCRRCPVLRFCHGDCPKHRVRVAEDGKPISVLCEGLRAFFTHSAPVLQAMAGELRAGRPAAGVMDVLRMLKP